MALIAETKGELRERCSDPTHAKFEALQRDMVAAMNEDGADAPGASIGTIDTAAVVESFTHMGEHLANVVRDTIHGIRAEDLAKAAA